MKALLALWERWKYGVRLATTEEALEYQAEAFLQDHGFPVTNNYKQLFGMMVQHMPAEDDTFIPHRLASAIRRMESNEAAYKMIQAAKRREVEAHKQQAANDAEAVQSAPSQVVQEANG
jgi:hypothetical protein